jgi:hypothetical protein
LRDAFTNAGHCSQLPPRHWFWHVHVQPVLLLPLTLTARPVQFVALVHVR